MAVDTTQAASHSADPFTTTPITLPPGESGSQARRWHSLSIQPRPLLIRLICSRPLPSLFLRESRALGPGDGIRCRYNPGRFSFGSSVHDHPHHSPSGRVGLSGPEMAFAVDTTQAASHSADPFTTTPITLPPGESGSRARRGHSLWTQLRPLLIWLIRSRPPPTTLPPGGLTNRWQSGSSGAFSGLKTVASPR
ncbi:hypothetical protein Mal65_01640 [Crateriforma conspicua]|nr:hypothetical protein Mal65_01640 [Crateriforma conspicua]